VVEGEDDMELLDQGKIFEPLGCLLFFNSENEKSFGGFEPLVKQTDVNVIKGGVESFPKRQDGWVRWISANR